MGWCACSFNYFAERLQMIEPIPFAGMIDLFEEILPLSDDEIKRIYSKYVEKFLENPNVEMQNFPLDFAREIEKAHGIK